MELLTRALAGVIAAWIPMDGGDDRRSNLENRRAEVFVGHSSPHTRNLTIVKSFQADGMKEKS